MDNRLIDQPMVGPISALLIEKSVTGEVDMRR